MLLRVAQEDVLVVLIIGLHYRPGGLIDTCVVFLIWSEDCILLLTILELRSVALSMTPARGTEHDALVHRRYRWKC